MKLLLLILFLIYWPIIHENTIYISETRIFPNPVQECMDEITPIWVDYNSPFTDRIEDICIYSLEMGVDPLLLSAIGVVESGLSGGCSGQRNNIWGVRVWSSGDDDFLYQLTRAVETLGYYTRNGTTRDLEKLADSYCQTDELWAAKVQGVIDDYTE